MATKKPKTTIPVLRDAPAPTPASRAPTNTASAKAASPSVARGDEGALAAGKALDTWLDEHGARCVRSMLATSGSTIQTYLINGRTMFVERYMDRGWDVYVSPCDSNDIKATLAAAERMLDLPVVNPSRLDAYQAAAQRCGTEIVRANQDTIPLVGGGITKHPLKRDVASSLAAALCSFGAEAKTIGIEGHDAYVYLTSRSFVPGDLS